MPCALHCYLINSFSFSCTSREGLCRRGSFIWFRGKWGVLAKKGCNAPRATDFQEKRNPLQADSIRWRRQFELLFVVVASSRKHPRVIFINHWIIERWSFTIHDRSRCLHHRPLVTPLPGFNRCRTRLHCPLASPLNLFACHSCLSVLSLQRHGRCPIPSPSPAHVAVCCCCLSCCRILDDC